MHSCRIFRCPSTLALAAALPLLTVVVGCGDSGKDSSTNAEATGDANDTTQPGAASDSDRSDSEVMLKLDGVRETLAGTARLEVREQNPVVNLVVTTVFSSNHDDLLQLQLAFEGVENTVGAHSSMVTGEANSPALVVAYLEQVSYSSQSGNLDITVSNNGAIQGRFNAQLVADGATSQDDVNSLPDSSKSFAVSGNFLGTWSVVCRSPVVGLPGDHSVTNSPYCNNLEF